MSERGKHGVYRRGEKWVARPYVSGVGHVWGGTRDTKAEAEALGLEVIQREQRLPAHQETVETFFARWLTDFPRPKESTNERYTTDAEPFVKQHGRRKLHQIEVRDALAYCRPRPWAVGALRAMFSDARREGLVTGTNPFSSLGLPRSRGRSDIVTVTEEELQTLGELAIDAHGRHFGPVFRSVIVFAAYTTMRPSEIFGLDRGDVDLEGETVAVRRQFYKRRVQLPKNGNTRDLPYLPPRAAEAIREMPRRVPPARCEITGGEILFCGKRGQRITQSALSLYWKPVRVAFESGLDPARRAEFQAARTSDPPTMDFYELRHFGATLMAELGVEPWVAAEMMGHEDGGDLFRKRYSHPREAIAKERLKQAFGRNVRDLRAVDDVEEATG